MNKFMSLALQQANIATQMDEVPVGAVIVHGNILLSAAHNLKEKLLDISAHAEILAIRDAEKKIGDWRLDGCDMYVTLEPCPMCAEAISQARIRRLYFGAYDPQNGAAGSAINLVGSTCEVYGGICEDECQKLLTGFFKKQRF